MKNHRSIALAVALAFAPPAFAQDAAQAPQLTPEQQKMMEAWQAAGTPGPQHAELAKLDGTFDAKSSMWWDPKAPPETSTGKLVNKMIFGGRYQQMTYDGEWQGEKFQGQGLVGYDNTRKKYFTTWADSVATAFYLAWGDYDAATKTYTYHSEYPDPAANGALVQVRQTVKVDSPDKFTFSWYETRPNAPEAKTMEIVYTRAK